MPGEWSGSCDARAEGAPGSGRRVIGFDLCERVRRIRLQEIPVRALQLIDRVGAEAASQRYFHKPASPLTASEAACLSAVIPNPRTVFNPQVNPRRVARRQRIILRGMPYINLP